MFDDERTPNPDSGDEPANNQPLDSKSPGSGDMSYEGPDLNSEPENDPDALGREPPLEELEHLDTPLLGGGHDGDVVLEDPASEDGSGRNVDEMGPPKVVFGPRNLALCVEAADQALAASGKFYTLGGHLVTVCRDPLTGHVTMTDVTGHPLKVALDTSVDWHRMGRNGIDRCAVPSDVLKAFAHGGEYTQLQPVKAVARQPFLREDGSLCLAEGYDPATKLYAGFGSERFNILENPTLKDAKAALGELLGILAEFPFRSELDRSASLCAMLTAAVRSSLPAAPMFLLRAHQAASGKTYLGRVISALATSQPATCNPFPPRAEECDKVLLAMLRKQPAVIEFDNIVGKLVSHASLCAAITADHYEGRELGRSSTLPVSTRTLIVASGNNIDIVGDLTRRCVTIDLDPGVSTPAGRKFRRGNLLDEVMAERSKYVSGALTIVRAWIEAGKPAAGTPPLVSFGQWSDWCREPLVWLGLPDPVTSVFRAMAEDPEREMLCTFLSEMETTFGIGGHFRVNDILDHASARAMGRDDELRDLLIEIAGDVGAAGRKRLGHWIKKHKGQVVDGRRLARVPVTRSTAVWCVEVVSP